MVQELSQNSADANARNVTVVSPAATVFAPQRPLPRKPALMLNGVELLSQKLVRAGLRILGVGRPVAVRVVRILEGVPGIRIDLQVWAFSEDCMAASKAWTSSGVMPRS